MRHRHRVTQLIGSLLVALLLVVGAAPALAAPPERYEPPTSPTPIPSATADLASKQAASGANDAAPTPDGAAISAPPVEDEPIPQNNVRARPESRPIDLSTPTPTPTKSAKAAASDTAAAAPTRPRLDEPVLRWLPEILDASKASGTPAEVIAGVMRLESSGDPRIISPVGARGLMQIMPDNLLGMGVPEGLWHDPATNIAAGGRFLAAQAAAYGSWNQAVGAYFGFGCDVFGTCTETYISVAMGWAAYYAPAIADPLNSGFGLLPADWSYGPIVPFVEAAPPKVETPPPSQPTPSTTPNPGKTPTAEPGATEPPTEAPTQAPTDVPAVPTVDVPTEAPTEVPIEPTVVPVEVPTDVPADPAANEQTTDEATDTAG